MNFLSEQTSYHRRSWCPAFMKPKNETSENWILSKRDKDGRRVAVLPFQDVDQTTVYFLLPRTVELPGFCSFRTWFPHLLSGSVSQSCTSEVLSPPNPPPLPHPHSQPQPPVPSSLLNLIPALRLVGFSAVGHCLYVCTPPHLTH